MRLPNFLLGLPNVSQLLSTRFRTPSAPCSLELSNALWGKTQKNTGPMSLGFSHPQDPVPWALAALVVLWCSQMHEFGCLCCWWWWCWWLWWWVWFCIFRASFSSCSQGEHFSATSFFSITGKNIWNTAVLVLKCHLLPKLQKIEPPGEDASWERVHQSHLLSPGASQATLPLTWLGRFWAASVSAEQSGGSSNLNMNRRVGDHGQWRTTDLLSCALSICSTDTP